MALSTFNTVCYVVGNTVLLFFYFLALTNLVVFIKRKLPWDIELQYSVLVVPLWILSSGTVILLMPDVFRAIPFIVAGLPAIIQGFFHARKRETLIDKITVYL